MGGTASAAQIEPTARLKVVKTTTLWKSPDGKVGAQRARFSPDKRWLAWFTTDGTVCTANLQNNRRVRSFRAPADSTFSDLVWSRQSQLAVCVRTIGKDGVTRRVAVARPEQGNLDLLTGTNGAYNVAWRDDGKAIAFSTKTALFHRDFATGKTENLLDGQKGWRPKGAPAFEDLVFHGERVIARTSGTMNWRAAAPGGGASMFVPVRGFCSDAPRDRLYMVRWLPGPVGIPRGCGVSGSIFPVKQPDATGRDEASDLKARDLPAPVVPFDHTAAKPYWLVDIWDATYPTTLRISPDGKTLTFCGVKAGVLSKNAWREFCIWRVPSDGSKPPAAVARCGPIFKRIDVGDTHFIGWRYKIDKAVVLGDLT
ncbi:MAG: hypothetical protein R6V58_07040, partial [Planctomycetota bacterium]